MDPMIFLAFAAVYVAMLLRGLRGAVAHGWWTPANLPLFVVAGLVYDNAVIGLGHLVGEGPMLEALNLARFWIHATVTPVLVAWGLHTLRRAGFGWARSGWYQVLSIGAALGLMVLEYVTEVRGLRLAPERAYGALSYTNVAGGGGPPLMVLVVALVLVVAGALLWRRQGWPWLCLGTLAMTVGSAVDLPLPSAAATNAAELVLLTSIMATTAFQNRAGTTPGARDRRAGD